jgi:LPS-assembly protein
MTARFCLCITLYLLCHPQVWAQTLTKQLPPPETGQQAPSAAADPPSDADSARSSIPIAQVVPPAETGTPVRIAAREQGKSGDIWTLSGDVEIHYRDYIVRADKVTYNEATGDVEAEGHLHLEGGRDDEQIDATRGTMNMDKETAHFYEVSGSIGVRRIPPGNSKMLTTSNPFMLTGRELFKDGPERYRVIDGSMTSCQLPKPDWQLLSSKINVADGKATARNSRFTLLRIPLFFLPYVTHPVDTASRQTGFLIPTFGTSSTKGIIFGEQIYWVINRSTDLTFGSEYYSKRGFAPRAEFRYRGRGPDFLTINFHSLFDRGLEPGNIDQGGQDLILNGRHDFTPQTRSVADIEYLSSYVYRQAFEENISIATSSEVKSQAFVQHENRGIAESVYLGRYQSFESDNPGDEIRILHLPSLAAEAVDHPLLGSRLLWGFSAATDVLTRSEPMFHARNVFRLDLHPRLALPFSFDGWTVRPEIAARETFYTKSELLPSIFNGEISPTLEPASLNRTEFEAGVDVRPPVLQRDFTSPWLEKLLGGDVRHTIEPDIHYRFVTGVHNFNSVLRVDEVDVVSNTDELEYGLTQRLFVRNTAGHPCNDDEAQTPSGLCGGGTVDWLSWNVAQKYFFNQNFGGAVIPGLRNVLAATLDFTGTAFLNGPRPYSPVISRLRLRTSSATDVEWDVDYDTKSGRLNSTNMLATYRHDQYNFSIGEFKLNTLQTPVTSAQNVTSAVTRFNQLRLLATYGNPGARGFSIGSNAGYDIVQDAIQFGGIETTYNWNCCGISAEYRRYALGQVRNENQYLFSFTLAGIGTAGNLRRAVRIF